MSGRKFKPVYHSYSIKGETESIVNNKEITDALVELRKHYDKQISSLDNNILSNLTLINNAVNITIKSAEYKKLYEKIIEVFGDIPPDQIVPGTVAAYMVGCYHSRNSPYGSSSLVCVNALPDPMLHPTNDLIILADNLSAYGNVVDAKRAIVYTSNLTNPLDLKLINKLANNGIEEVAVVNYANGKYNTIIPVTPLKLIAKSMAGSASPTKDTSNSTMILLVIAIIIFILLLIYLVFIRK